MQQATRFHFLSLWCGLTQPHPGSNFALLARADANGEIPPDGLSGRFRIRE